MKTPEEKSDSLDAFILKQRDIHTQFSGMDERILDAINRAPEPRRPFSLREFIKNIIDAIQPYRKPLAAFASVVLVFCVFVIIKSVINVTETENNLVMSQDVIIAKGNVGFTYFVKPNGKDSLVRAVENGWYAPGDVFQPVYISQHPFYIHLFLINNKKKAQCFTCDSIHGFRQMPSKGGNLPFAIELDKENGSELFVSVISESRVNGVKVKSIIKKILKKHDHLSATFRDRVQSVLGKYIQIHFLKIQKRR